MAAMHVEYYKATCRPVGVNVTIFTWMEGYLLFVELHEGDRIVIRNAQGKLMAAVAVPFFQESSPLKIELMAIQLGFFEGDMASGPKMALYSVYFRFRLLYRD